MNRYMPLIVLVVLGQTVLAYILVENVLIRRLSGPPPVELQEVKADVSVSDEPDQLEQQNPLLRDMIIAILSSKKLAEVDSPEDREFIKDKIRFALNEHLTTGEILQVYFTSFIIQ